MSGLLAHGIGVVDDLPVPAWLFYYGAALVLIASFVALGLLWREPRLDAAHERPVLRVPRSVGVVLRAASLALFVLVIGAGLLGEHSPTRNLAPSAVYVAFWLGVPLLSVLLGDVWRVLDPWRAGADGVAFLARRVGLTWRPPLEYPAALGRWPATALLTAFVALELAYPSPDDPKSVAVAALVYSWLTWMGAAAFGRDAWFAKGDGFAGYFGLFARMASFVWRSGVLLTRRPLTGLATRDELPGTVALISIVLGSVAFDGLSRTNWWEDRTHATADPAQMATNLVGLTACTALVAASYLAATSIADRLARRGGLRNDFVGSLVPIAFAYVVAHYFSLFVLQGQFLFSIVSDPFGYGWDVFGTRGYVPDLTVLAPETIWYVQVGALVVGHVLGLVVAHDRALTVIPSVRRAMRAQYAMLALMVVYTAGGMWILSRP